MTKEMDEFICQILIGGMFVIVALLVLALLYIIYQAIPEFILLWKTHRMNLKIRKEERKK
jgi:hypothetical protein